MKKLICAVRRYLTQKTSGVSFIFFALGATLLLTFLNAWDLHRQLYAGGLLVVATILWANRKRISILATCILVLIALEVGNFDGTNLAFAGFTGKAVWMFFSFNILAFGIAEAGLHRRLALYMLRMARGNIQITMLIALLIIDLSLLFIPTGIGRIVLFFPVFMRIAEELGLKKSSNFVKGILVGAGILSTIGNSAVMIGGAVSILAAELFFQVVDYQWTYLGWIMAFYPTVLIYTVLLWIVLLKVFPPEKLEAEEVRAKIEEHISGLTHLNKQEKKILLITICVLGLFIIGHRIGLQPLLVSLLALFLILTPPYEVNWKKSLQAVDWLIFIFVGTILSLVSFVQKADFPEQVGNLFLQVNAFNTDEYRSIFLIALFVIFILIRIPLSAGVLYNGIVLPLVFELAWLLGINPIWAGMLVHQLGTGLIFLPSQSPQVMFVFQKIDVETRKVISVGLLAFSMLLAISLLAAFYYWPLLGYQYKL